MDITITWANGGGYQPTDGWNVLYREHTPTNINSWILATDPPLPPATGQYTLTGLTPNVIYDIAVVKSCVSVFDQVSQVLLSYISCPIVSTWQGPVVNGKPTLFYSVYYEEGDDINTVKVRLYDTTPDVFQITGAIGNGTNILFTTGSVHNLLINSEVVVAGINPPGYNGTYTITSTTASGFVVAGTYTGVFVPGGGTVTYYPGMMGDIPEPRVNNVIGKTAYTVINASPTNPPNFIAAHNCGTDGLAFVFPNSTNSAAGYFGTEHGNINDGLLCGSGLGIGQNGTATTFSPILLDYNTTLNPRQYKLGTVGGLDRGANFGPNPPITMLGGQCPGDSIVGVTSYFTFDDDASQPYRNLNVANSANISAAICFDVLTGGVDYTLGDGLGRTNINDYTFSFATSDGVNTFPLLDNAGNPVTSYNGSYNIYAPVKIQTYAPGGGISGGYTITNAVVAGGNTTYTYIGGTNAFTVGQDVFVNNINPISYNFSLTSKTITAATANSFTVSYNPAGTYQTGGVASGYTELTDGMTITVDLLPGPVNVITLTNQNYLGFTLKEVLDDIVNSINTTTSYTALAVVVAGLPYIKIGVPGTTYTSASIKFEGPNILTKGTPDFDQTSSAGTIGSTNSSVIYNGFLYAAFGESTAKIVASDTNNPTSAANYSHTINTTVNEIVLVPDAPPSTAYSLDHVASGGNYSLNIALNSNNGYVYVADNTTVSIYDGTTLIDSQDLSALLNGPTTPIRLMEFNTTDNYLYVFTDGSSANFRIVLNPSVGTWSIGHTGTYAQTNYLTRGTITAWNNLTSGATAAMGTITSAPTAPIPLGTIPNPPNDTIANTLSFQDSTKSWAIPPIYNYNRFQAGSSYGVYNYTQQTLGFPFYYSGSAPYTYPGISGTTVQIHNGVDTAGGAIPFTASNGDSYGIFSVFKIVDYTANFTSRTWSDTSRYLIEAGRNAGSNGFLNTTGYTSTVFTPDSYARTFSNTNERMIKSDIALDGTSQYLLYEITDGGTCYNNVNNLIYVSLGDGTYQTITSGGAVSTPYQIYADFPTNSVLLNAPLQLTVDPVGGNVYGVVRDARLSTGLDDKNIYILSSTGQIGTVDGLSKWNTAICGQPSFDSNKLYFTGKYNRTIYEYDLNVGTWISKVIPSLYEKLNGFTYGDGTLIERTQGASFIGNGKFVVMNYLQQTFSTQIKYMYDVANLFVYDFATNTVDQALIGTGVNTYSGTVGSYNTNHYGEFFGYNDYNNDYCYGGLGIKTNPSNGQIFWKKSLSDQVYFSEPHNETGVAQIWGTMFYGSSGLIRIWNIQANGSLQQSVRTIYDYYSSWSNLIYDSYYQKVVSMPTGLGYQIYLANPKTLGGMHGVNTIGANNKNTGTFMNGLTPSINNLGKPTTVYNAVVSSGTIEYSVRPSGSLINGVFPHHYAVGDVVLISSIVSTPALQLNFTSATIIAVTQTTFTIANTTGTSATYGSGGSVRLAEYANMWATGSLSTDNTGNIYLWGPALSGIPTIISDSSMFLKYKSSDILTQRETPDFAVIGPISNTCSATPNSVFRILANSLTNYSTINVQSQGTIWVLGSKNPTCTIYNITNATYNSNAQTARYYINNSFVIGKVVNISGINPSPYNLTRVKITDVDTLNTPQQWFEVSYTGTNPGTFISPTPPTTTGTVQLSTNWVINIYNSSDFSLVNSIDLGFINSYLDSFANLAGSFQYSAAEEKIYLYSYLSSSPVYIFDTITNTLVQSNSFDRMTLGYNKLNCVYTLEDVNGVPYFSAYTSTDTPTRRWFRLTAGDRTYQNNVHNELIVSTTDVVGTTSKTYDLYNLNNMSDTFGQWKEITDTTWATIPSALTLTLGDRVEFVSFIIDKPLVEIRNLTQATTFAITSISGLPLVTILIDGVSIVSGDVLEFEFTNPANPSCPFINQTTITII